MYRRSGRGRLLLLAFLALSILIITLDFRGNAGGPLERAKDLSVAVVEPIQRGFTAVFRPVGNFFSSLGELSDLRAQNQELEAELRATRAEVSRAESLVREIERLTTILELDEPWIAMERVTARVSGQSPSNYKWAVFIDKGRDDGILPDMAVVAPEGLVGKVVRADAGTSLVLLLIDRQGAAAARLEDRRDTGKVEGNGGSELLSLELIGSNADVRVGDQVVTSGYDDGIFPPGIPIGYVEEVVEDARAPDQTIMVDPHVDFPALLGDYVQVLLGPGRRVGTQEGG